MKNKRKIQIKINAGEKAIFFRLTRETCSFMFDIFRRNSNFDRSYLEHISNVAVSLGKEKNPFQIIDFSEILEEMKKKKKKQK